MGKKLFAGLGLAVLLVTAAGCGGGGDAAGDKPAPKAAAQKPAPSAAASPDLSGIPKVVARVNGQPISRAEFVDAYTQQFQQAAAQSGSTQGSLDQSRLKKQTAQSLVGTELLLQEADRKGIHASGKDVDRTLSQLAVQNGIKSPAQLRQTLKQQGMTLQQVRSQVRDQVVIDKVITAEGGDTTPTRAEVKKLYKQLVAQQQASGSKGKVPPFTQVEPQLEQRLQSQKKSAAAQRVVSRLRSSAEVTINL